MLKYLLTLIGYFAIASCYAQKNYGLSQDYFVYQNQRSTIVPSIYLLTNNNWYTSLRYNFEEDRVFSAQFGKRFTKKERTDLSVTPSAGFLWGKWNGLNVGIKSELETGKFSFFSEDEYCFSIKNRSDNFLYNWTEASVKLSGLFRSGLALQSGSSLDQTWYAEPGIMLSCKLKNFELPLYLFKTSSSSIYFVTGIHWLLKD